MPRGMGPGYGRRGRGIYHNGLYEGVDILILLGILYFLFKLLIVALPYAVGLIVLLFLRSFFRRSFWLF